MTKQILTEAQINKLDLLNEALENDNMDDSEFTMVLFELKEEGIDVERVLNERYGVEF